MKTLIQKFNELAKAKITKAKVAKIQQAVADGNDLLVTVEPAEATDDVVEEFENAVSDLESALSDVEMACDDFDGAEDKEERDEALETLDSGLTDTVSALEALNGVAAVSAVSYDEVKGQIQADFVSRVLGQKDKFDEAMKVWLAAEDKPAWRYKRKKFYEELAAAIQNRDSGAVQNSPSKA